MDLNGLAFRVVENGDPFPQATRETVFRFEQFASCVSATYAGGAVEVGRLLGLLTGDTLELGFVQIDRAGELSQGRAFARIERASDGRARIVRETEWELADGPRRLILEQI